MSLCLLLPLRVQKTPFVQCVLRPLRTMTPSEYCLASECPQQYLCVYKHRVNDSLCLHTVGVKKVPFRLRSMVVVRSDE